MSRGVEQLGVCHVVVEVEVESAAPCADAGEVGEQARGEQPGSEEAFESDLIFFT